MIIKTNLPYYLNHLLEHILYREGWLFWTDPTHAIHSVYPDYVVYSIEHSDEASFIKHLRQMDKNHLRNLMLHEANVISAELSTIYHDDPARWAYTLAVYGETVESIKGSNEWLEAIYLQSISSSSLDQILDSLVNISKEEHFSRVQDEVVDRAVANLKLADSANRELIYQKYENTSLINLFKNRYSFLSSIFSKYGTASPGHKTVFYDLFPESVKTVLTIFWQKGVRPIEKVDDSKISQNALQNEINRLKSLIFGSSEFDEEDYRRKSLFYFNQPLTKPELTDITELFDSINLES